MAFLISLLHRNQNRRTFVPEQEHLELGGQRLARFATNGVDIVGAFEIVELIEETSDSVSAQFVFPLGDVQGAEEETARRVTLERRIRCSQFRSS